jgi:hypothetical protein
LPELCVGGGVVIRDRRQVEFWLKRFLVWHWGVGRIGHVRSPVDPQL